MTRITAIVATVYIVIIILSFFDGIVTIVKAAQINSIIGIRQMFAIFCVYLMFSGSLSILVNVINFVICHRSRNTSYLFLKNSKISK